MKTKPSFDRWLSGSIAIFGAGAPILGPLCLSLWLDAQHPTLVWLRILAAVVCVAAATLWPIYVTDFLRVALRHDARLGEADSKTSEETGATSVLR
jgi:hypothetical protein